MGQNGAKKTRLDWLEKAQSGNPYVYVAEIVPSVPATDDK